MDFGKINYGRTGRGTQRSCWAASGIPPAGQADANKQLAMRI